MFSVLMCLRWINVGPTLYSCMYILEILQHYTHVIGGPRGRVVKVADFSALDHSIISAMWVRASHGARIHM